MGKKATLIAVVIAIMLVMPGTQFSSISSANFFPDPGPDIPRVYIRSNGDVEPASAPIERLGNIYKLTDKMIMKTIVIQRDNIVFDGSGYLIEGNKSWMGIAPRWGDSGNNGIIISGQNNINITNLNIEKFTAGVRISGSSHINIVGNNFTEEAAVFDSPMGIVAEASSHVLIENNNFTRINGPAIACNGTNNTIRGNVLTDIIDGIDGSIALQGSSNAVIDNKIESAYPSIGLGLADSNIIARNHITGGLSLVSCSNNIIFSNNLTSIRIIFGSNNTFYANRIANNQCAVTLDQGAVNKTFYGNAFVLNCSIRKSAAGITFWDNGTIGNYWSDYNGTDSNGDGIGDSPYIITGVEWDTDVGGDVNFVAGQDNYPLMAPYDLENEAIVLPRNESFLAVLFAVSIAAVFVGAGLLFYHRKRRSEVEQA